MTLYGNTTELMEDEIHPSKPETGVTYDSSKLGKLEGLEAVRRKPGMYIGARDEPRFTLRRKLWITGGRTLPGCCRPHRRGHYATAHFRFVTTGAASRWTFTRNTGFPELSWCLTTLHSGGKYGQGATPIPAARTASAPSV